MRAPAQHHWSQHQPEGSVVQPATILLLPSPLAETPVLPSMVAQYHKLPWNQMVVYMSSPEIF